MKFDGFIFDFDGLILDTEMPRFTAWWEEFHKLGFPLTFKDWWKTIGTGPSAYDPAEHLYELTHGNVDRVILRQSAGVRADELVAGASVLPGVREFIQAAALANKPMAVASSSEYDWVTGHLSRLELLPLFKAVFTAHDVKNVKPDPELYLLASRSLGLPINKILAFEDSPNGIKAAKAAGLSCLAVPNRITREMDLGCADIVMTSFEDLHPDNDFAL